MIVTSLAAAAALVAGCSEAPRSPAAPAAVDERPATLGQRARVAPAVDLGASAATADEPKLASPLGEHTPSIPQYSSYVLTMPEVPGVVPWKTLAKVQLAASSDPAPRFDPAITALNAQQVKLQGFMLPLETGEKHKRFILMALPPSCSFCLPGGPESVVEVIAREPVKFTIEPIVVSGKFNVLKNDPIGLFYRLTEAKPAAPG